MRHPHFFLGTFLVTSITIAAPPPAFRLSEPWQTAYTGNDATGSHVIALWQFESGAETNDASGKGHPLTLHGAKPATQGRFGSGLESFPGWPVADKRHAAVAALHPALSPKGAFTVELWLQPKPELKPELQPYLVDKKYVAHADYQLILSSAEKDGSRRLMVNLGFGDDSASFHSEPARYEPGVWHHVAFSYDDEGEVRFYRDGAMLGKASHPGRGTVVAGRHPLSIGDRIGSYYHGFAGIIDQVRICNGALEFRPAAFIFTPERASFVRMEPAPPFDFSVRNLQKTTLQGARVYLSVAGIKGQEFAVPALASGATHALRWQVDTSLRPGTYSLKARLEMPAERPYRTEEEFPFVIVPRPLPHRMPVIMWGVGQGAVVKEIPRLKEIGFTHCLGLGADFGAIWEAGKPTFAAKPEAVADAKRALNEALANDIGVVAQLSPGHWLKERKDLQRVDRKGQPYKRPDVNAALPGLAEFCQNVGASVAQTYGSFPAFQAALIDTEVRDGSQVSFSAFDREQYRKMSGTDIPAEITGKNGVDWRKLRDFPADRVIPDDHALLKFYRWFWTVGDGWNGLHSAVHRGLKSTGRADLWTWFDPAVRTASIAGSGGGVDVLSQWTYSYPDPIRLGMPADELFAMAGLATPPQRVMKMTQLIWYRSQTAPAAAGTNALANPWDDHDPDAAYITIAPMHLREAFWTKIARPVRGIMYHGWQSLVPTGSTGGYRFTHPDTQHELRRLIKQVVEPLGPTLLQVPDRRSDVAFLESFASQMFAQRGAYGWSQGWSGDAYLILHYARLQPEVVYDETVLKRGLDGYQLLVLADCDVLTAGVAKRIKEFQARGGLVIADERLAPGIKADVVIPSYTRMRKPVADKSELLARAATLRKALDGRYARLLDTDDANVIPRCRQSGASDYLFLVNDHREFGDYVGQHGLVMENGLPSKATLTLRRAKGHVYDLVTGREVGTTASAGQLRLPVDLGPCEGRVFMVTDEAIGNVEISGPAAAKLGESPACAVAVKSAGGKLVDAVVPVRIEIADPSGRVAEFSGYYGAAGGKVDLKLDLARNDSPGLWRIRATELASGMTASHYIRVSR